MRITEIGIAVIALVGGASPMLRETSQPRVIHVVDTVFVKSQPTITSVDYDAIASRVITRMKANAADPTVIEGDLIVKGRLGIRGAPEPQTDYAVTIHGPGSADMLFVSNESLQDPQRAGSQHRHVGTIGVAQDGGLRFGQNSLCFADARGCVADDRHRRYAYAGYDSMGDMSFYLADVDSVSGAAKAPLAQSLVLSLLAWDGNIHISSLRPNQKIIFKGSTTLNAADLAWEVPLRAGPTP